MFEVHQNGNLKYLQKEHVYFYAPESNSKMASFSQTHTTTDCAPIVFAGKFNPKSLSYRVVHIGQDLFHCVMFNRANYSFSYIFDSQYEFEQFAQFYGLDF